MASRTAALRVGGEVVHHHDVAGLERRHQHLLDIGQEGQRRAWRHRAPWERSFRSASRRRRRSWSSSARGEPRRGNDVHAEPGRSAAPSWWKPRSRRRRLAVQGRDRAGRRTRPAGVAARQVAAARWREPFFLKVMPRRWKKRHTVLWRPAPRARSPDEPRSPPGSCPGSLRPAPEPSRHVPRSGASACRRLAAWADSCPFAARRRPT